jgi:hypothetical protein
MRKTLIVLVIMLVLALSGGAVFLWQRNAAALVEFQENVEGFTRAMNLAQIIAAESAAGRLTWEHNAAGIAQVENMIQKLEAKESIHFPEMRKVSVKGMRSAQEAIRIRQETLQLKTDIERGILPENSIMTRTRLNRLADSTDTRDTELKLARWELCAYIDRPEKSLPHGWSGLETFRKECR